jgi:hypothetical protein
MPRYRSCAAAHAVYCSTRSIVPTHTPDVWHACPLLSCAVEHDARGVPPGMTAQAAWRCLRQL